jgi:predicted MFS family arabinose efflux permease
MVVPFMTLYLVSARGFSVVAAGEMLAGYGAGALVAPLIGGALADHAGRRVTLLGGTLTGAAVMVALAYARQTPLIVVLILLLGVTLEVPRPVTQALVADLVAEEDRARACAALSAASAYGVFRLAPRLRPVTPDCAGPGDDVESATAQRHAPNRVGMV